MINPNRSEIRGVIASEPRARSDFSTGTRSGATYMYGYYVGGLLCQRATLCLLVDKIVPELQKL